jgi:hypothetical protein
LKKWCGQIEWLRRYCAATCGTCVNLHKCTDDVYVIDPKYCDKLAMTTLPPVNPTDPPTSSLPPTILLPGSTIPQDEIAPPTFYLPTMPPSFLLPESTMLQVEFALPTSPLPPTILAPGPLIPQETSAPSTPFSASEKANGQFAQVNETPTTECNNYCGLQISAPNNPNVSYFYCFFRYIVIWSMKKFVR